MPSNTHWFNTTRLLFCFLFVHALSSISTMCSAPPMTAGCHKKYSTNIAQRTFPVNDSWFTRKCATTSNKLMRISFLRPEAHYIKNLTNRQLRAEEECIMTDSPCNFTFCTSPHIAISHTTRSAKFPIFLTFRTRCIQSITNETNSLTELNAFLSIKC